MIVERDLVLIDDHLIESHYAVAESSCPTVLTGNLLAHASLLSMFSLVSLSLTLDDLQ